MKVYTKTGDNGTTSLSDGKRVSKADGLLHSYGTVDELNAFLGLVISEENMDFLTEIQNQLFVVGGLLATPLEYWTRYYDLDSLDAFTRRLESEIDQMSESLEPLRGFILPQGNVTIAHVHVCRTVCRRAEREVVALLERDEAYNRVQKLLNRLSDYFFVLARFFHKKYGIPETLYKSAK